MISPRTVAVIGALAVVGGAQEEQGADQRYVAFFGQVRQTQLEVGNNTTLLEALSRIELTDAADLRAVILVRRDPAPVVVEVDLRRMILTGNTINNVVLRAGDLLWVPERGRQQNPRERSDVLEAIVFVDRLTHDPDPIRRAMAALAIGALGEAAVVPHLEQALGQDPFVAREVVTALGMIGPAAKETIPALEKLAEHDDRQIAERAKAALRQIRKQ